MTLNPDFALIVFCASMFGALKCGFRSMASLMLVRNVVGELQPKRTLAASRGFLAAARLSCYWCLSRSASCHAVFIQVRKQHNFCEQCNHVAVACSVALGV